MHRVVIWDPKGAHPEGTVVTGDNGMNLMHLRGVVTLPIDPVQVARVHALGGYFRRAWGSGWTFDRASATRGCPMMLLVSPYVKFVHWVARIEPMRPDEQTTGTLRLTPSTQHAQANFTGGLSADGPVLDLSTLGAVDDQGGWIVRGRNRLSVTGEGLLATELYGALTNAEIMWSAMSQSDQPE